MGCRVVSKAKTTEASSARDAPAKSAAMPTRAATRMSMPECGRAQAATAPMAEPIPPPIVKRGASVPPEVPVPSEIDQDTSLATQKTTTAVPARSPDRMRSMLS